MTHRAASLRRSLGAVVALALTTQAPAHAESLADALIAAYRTSGLLEQNRALLRAADEDVAQAVATLRPVIDYAANAQATYIPETPSALPPGSDFDNVTGTASAQLTADLLIYDFGASQIAVDAAKETVLATREQLVGIEQDVLLRAVSAYVGVQAAIAFVDLGENNVRLISEELRAARERFEVGEVTRTDVALAESRLASARSNLAASQGDLARAREEYNAVVGRFPQSLQPRPPAPQIPATEGAAKTVAQKTHPDIKGQQHRVMSAELNVERARRAMLPSVNGNATTTLGEGLNVRHSLGLNLSGPIYRGGRLSSIFRQAQAQRNAERGSLLTTERGITQNVGNAWATLQVANASLRATEEEVRAAEVAFRGFQEEATLGARTTLDVLDAEQDLLDARASRIQARADMYVATYQVLEAMGILTADHLGLGVPTYDPVAYYDAVDDAPVREVSPQGERLDRVINKLRP